MHYETTISLKENFAIAKARYQPYINLANQIYSIEELSNEEIIKEFKKGEIKSLYFRSLKVSFDDDFAINVDKLIKAGIREIIILCNKEESDLSTEQLNDFLTKHKIYINFRIAQITHEELDKIQSDEVGENNLLGFDEFGDNYNQLLFKNGAIINFLNNDDSEKIVLANHADHRKFISQKHEFTLTEPNYITTSNSTAIKLRPKEINKLKKLHTNLEIAKNIDLKIGINKETEEENELDLDKEQEDNKFDRNEAIKRAEKLSKALFLEEYMLQGTLGNDAVNDDVLSNIINKIFKGHKKIQYISNKALYSVIKNYLLFKEGINFDNLPLGFALKKGILFATEQRLSSMPINEFTFKLDNVKSEISNPLDYSWLTFASKASISLNDIYGSSVAPKIEGLDTHPHIGDTSGDIMLDIPFNQDVSHYYVQHDTQEPKFLPTTYRIYLNNKLATTTKFFGIEFSNLDTSDINRLQDIQDNLSKRNLLEIFSNLLISGSLGNGNFLLENKAILFLEKLFEEILPISTSNKKQDFFFKILSAHKFEQNNLEDVFEGVDGFYKKFHELQLKLAIQDSEQLENKIINIIINQLQGSNNFKVLLERLGFILENTINSGGSLNEQIEYLSNKDTGQILSDPGYYLKAREFSLNVAHKAALLEKKFYEPDDSKILKADIIESITNYNSEKYYETKYINDIYTYQFYANNVIAGSFRYLSQVASHKRASIDTYTQYFKQVITKPMASILPHAKANYCKGNEAKVDMDLKTVDYSITDDIAYKYSIISSSSGTIEHYLAHTSSLDEVIAKISKVSPAFIVIAIIGQKILYAYHTKSVQGSFDLTEGYIQEYDTTRLIKNYAKYNDNKNIFYRLDDNKVTDIYTKYLDITRLGTHPDFMQIISDLQGSWSTPTPIQIKYMDDGEYNIVLEFSGERDELGLDYEREIFKASELNLPESLNRKIKDFYKNNPGESTIPLFYLDIKGTIFEKYKFLALQPHEQELIELSDRSLEILKQIYYSAPKSKAENACYSSIGVVSNEVNLVNNFTTKQATLNTKLLALNILSSSDRHYDSQYPDQEFGSYLSLFNTLLAPFKIYNSVKLFEIETEPYEDFNSKVVYLDNRPKSIDKPKEVQQKEEQHEKLIDKFLNIYKENPEFNFAQVVAIGLIANIDINLTDEVIKNAKVLLSYNGYFTQTLRVLFSVSVSENYDLNELNNRAKLIAQNIIKLNQDIEHEAQQVKLHDLLTQNGAHPENLVFFAVCLAKDEEITADKIQSLVTKIANLDFSLKNQLLSSFAKAKLPFAHGEVINNNFPKLSLSSLDNPEEIKHIIMEAQLEQVNYEHATRFNDISLDSMENAKVDLSEIKTKYNLQISQEYTYANLKEALVKDNNFIKEQFKTEGNIDLDLLAAMFETITKHEGDYKTRIKTIAKLLYNTNKTLSDQYLEIDTNKRNLDIILSRLAKAVEKDKFLDILSFISQESIVKLLMFLKSLSQTSLQNKGYTILSLLESVGVKLIDEHFESFKIATEKFLNDDINIDLVQLYQLIGKISAAGYRSLLVKEIIEYAIENQDYTIVTLLSKANGNTDHIEKLVNWICDITPQEIQVLNKTIGTNSKQWLGITQVDKIEIIGEIALNLQNQLKPTQYKEIIEYIAKNDLAYAKLLQSYLVIYSIENLPLTTRINLVMDNINNLEALQSFFADNNLERFNYNKERVINKISQILLKNIDTSLKQEIQDKLQQNFANILEKANSYKDLNINKIHDKAISLKHTRMLSKEADLDEIIELDLEFLSLSFELLYRQTGKVPRDVQIISHLNSLLRYESIIKEIATGEGKSISTALFAAYLWFTGQTVDVVSSSQALARRDLKEFGSFYDVLGIKRSDRIITSDSFKDEYKKGGINYSTASDLALFRANREFYSNTHDVSLNADVSLVCDEVDSVLTSEVNYKLATSMITTNQLETRALFSYILEFTTSSIFKNNHLDRQDDIKNLELYLHYQLLKYDTSYKYPLNAIQMNELKINDDPLANKLYLLHRALVKADQNKFKLFDKLLDAVIIAKSLENGVDYVILKEDLDNQKELLKATPIIKDQPSKGTSFGDGVQAFLHLLIEEKMPHLAGRFDVSAPSSTIFNLSPKNFFDYYRLTGGRIIGLTGTAGNIEEIEEFRTINKMLSFNIPRFKDDLRNISQKIVANKEEQTEKLLEIIQSGDRNKPVVVFTENTKSTEEIYNKLQNLRDHIQLYAASNLDTDTIENVVNKAGNDGYLTVTTPMLGRGTDFLTSNPDGFIAINLCTRITKITLWQIYGRIGRNGQKGEIISLFNKEIFGEDIDQYMDSISLLEKEQRMESGPLTDVLKFFNQVNHDNPINAITCNEFIRNAWNNLIETNSESKTYRDLRANLVAIVKVEYPLGSKKLDDYLQRIDNGTPAADALESTQAKNCYQANYIVQEVKPHKLLFTQNDLANARYHYWPAEQHGSSIYINKIEIPSIGQENAYKLLYNQIYQVQLAVMATHVFTITDLTFKLYRYITLECNLHRANIDVTCIYMHNNEVKWSGYGYSTGKIKMGYAAKDGIPKKIYHSLYEKLKNGSLSLDLEEKEALKQHFIANGSGYSTEFDGEGSNGDLMVDEFKKSFNSYKARVNSAEVNKISPLIDNFMNIMDLDLNKLEYSKYQAIHIVTKFDSSASHVESLLTDGNFLFWINRGADTTGSGPGIKVFKIIKDIEFVKDTLKWLQVEEKSQAETRSKIYTMLRQDDDQNIPEHVLIPMQAQAIGNCGWTQTKAMLKAAAIIGRIGHLTELPDIEAQEWQKAIKDADDIYKDFVNYDIAKRLEAIVFTINPEFKPVFLDIQEQEEINSRRDILENPITDELLKKINHLFNHKADKFINTIYEKQITNVRDLIALEVALNSDAGRALKRIDGEEKTKLELQLYQTNKVHDFEQLNSVYAAIEKSRIDFAPIQDQLLKQITNYLTDSTYNIAKIYDFNDMLTEKIKECLDECTAECVMTKIEHQIIEETQEICLAQIPSLTGIDNIYPIIIN